MARLPYPDPDALPAEIRDTLAHLPVQLNVFRMLAHATTLFRPWLRLGTAILNELELDPQLRELAILAVAREIGCAYEWGQHVALARLVGVSDEQIAAVERGDIDEPCFGSREKITLAATQAWLRQPRLEDTLWAELSSHFSPRQLIELCLVVGFYSMLARVLESAEVDLDAPFAQALASKQ
jgi:AhpD family alkylhydroperoxidase